MISINRYDRVFDDDDNFYDVDLRRLKTENNPSPTKSSAITSTKSHIAIIRPQSVTPQ